MLQVRIEDVDFLIDYTLTRDGEFESVSAYMLQDSQDIYHVLKPEVQRRIDQKAWEDWEGASQDQEDYREDR